MRITNSFPNGAARAIRCAIASAVCLSVLWADPPAATPVGAKTPVLLIKVARGQGGVNSTTTPNVVVPQVLITDGDNNPGPGVSVTFTVDKPSLGKFATGQASLATKTDEQGVATARGYVPTRSGNLTMSVNAEKNGVKATEGEIHQRNWNKPYSASLGAPRKKWPMMAAAAGAAGAVAAVVLTGGSPEAIATITAGQVGIGGPK